MDTLTARRDANAKAKGTTRSRHDERSRSATLWSPLGLTHPGPIRHCHLLCHLCQPCTFYAKNACGKGDECPFAHADCRADADCRNDRCGFRHPSRPAATAQDRAASAPGKAPRPTARANPPRPAVLPPLAGSGSRVGAAAASVSDGPPDQPDECASEDGSESSTVSLPSARPCRGGAHCPDVTCEYLHPDSRPSVCPDFEMCTEWACTQLHPRDRRRRCHHAERCHNAACEMLHPPSRNVCALADECALFECADVHPASRPRACRSGAACWTTACRMLHPPERLACSEGALCCDFFCTAMHSPKRSPLCKLAAHCRDVGCAALHPPDRELPEDEDDDDESDVQPSAPAARSVVAASSASSSTSKAPRDSRSGTNVSNVPLKQLAVRDNERAAAGLPILNARQEFCSRLAKERVLVVTAATGSAKTTQLPQYCADDDALNGGLVICTQPRLVAAMSIAKRIATEYDGSDCGNSVGYAVGATHVAGRRIMLMTDAQLIRQLRKDPLLSNVSVLMIDEAHERSLATDTVIGVAKRLLQQRPAGFHVVVASATINPAAFIQFFAPVAPACRAALDVPGRVFPVSLEHRAADPALRFQPRLIQQFLVPVLLEAVQQHKEGHVIVFLPGQGEIESALREFTRLNHDANIQALPLFGSLPPEQQELVIRFDDDKTSAASRMVCFSTNVAETSLTVKGVRLIIDSGLAKEARYDPVRRINVVELVTTTRRTCRPTRSRRDGKETRQ